MAFFEAAYAASERPVRLIDADPDLFEGLDGAARRSGVHDLTVAVVRVPSDRGASRSIPWTSGSGCSCSKG